ncbi:MAG: hypothetical protein IH866_02680 [Chloroflexi bacterium]|nr:hypothetical protein [Chloroflexota bacterium]
MPTYEYRCPDCAHEYEKREGFDAPAAQKCPQCTGTAQRVIYAPPIVFKGSGFYVTDSRKPDSDASAESGSVASDSKPAEDAAPGKKSDSDSGKDAEPAAAT